MIDSAGYLFTNAGGMHLDSIPTESEADHQVQKWNDNGKWQPICMDKQWARHTPEHEDKIPPPESGMVRAQFVHDSAEHS